MSDQFCASCLVTICKFRFPQLDERERDLEGNGVRRPAAWPAGGGWRTISSAMRNFHQQASPSDSASGYYRHAHVAA